MGTGESLVSRCKVRCKVKVCRRESPKLCDCKNSQWNYVLTSVFHNYYIITLLVQEF